MSNFIYARYDPLPVVVQGAMGTFHKDVYHQAINKAFHLHTGIISTLAVATAVEDRTIELVDASSFLVGDALAFNGGFLIPSFPVVTAKAGNILTLDRLLDRALPAGEEVGTVETDMAVTGSPSSPVIYILEPPQGAIWYITRLIFSMTHGSAGDLGLFGDLAALTNGVTLRVRLDGVYSTITNWKVNSDIKRDFYDVDFDTRSGGSGVAGTSGRGSFDKLNVAVELDGNKGDQLELMIQDDLVGLVHYELNGQGYAGL